MGDPLKSVLFVYKQKNGKFFRYQIYEDKSFLIFSRMVYKPMHNHEN